MQKAIPPWRKVTTAGLVLTLALCLPAEATLAQGRATTRTIDGPSPVVVVDPGITHTLQLPAGRLRLLRRALTAGAYLPDGELRELADRGDSLAAAQLTKRLVARDPAAHAPAIAWYGARAVAAGRGYLLDEMIAAMRRLPPDGVPAARRHFLMRVLYANAWAGDGAALDAVVELNGAGRLFGPLSRQTGTRIARAAAHSDAGRAMSLALELLARPDPTDVELETARQLLTLAANAPSLSVRATAANLAGLVRARLEGPANPAARSRAEEADG